MQGREVNFPKTCLRNPAEVFRVDANGIALVKYQIDGGFIEFADCAGRIAVCVVATDSGEWTRVEARRQALIATEKAFRFDPGRCASDLAVLQAMVRKEQK